MPSIRRPAVEVTQTTISTSPTILSPDLAACLIGPCVQIVSAFDDDGDPQAEGLAGTYEDGQGTVAYTLPGLKTGADPDPYVSEQRVFLVTGSEWVELNSESDEESIASGTGDGTYTSSSKVFNTPSGNFVSDGVEAGDAVRLTYAGTVYDLIIATVTDDNNVVVTTDLIGEDLVSENWSIVRNPAQFVYKTAEAQASVAIITDEDNYLTFGCVDGGAYDGADGDSLSLVVEETDAVIDDTGIFIGGCIFGSSAVDFTTAVGAIGAVTNKLLRPSAVGDGKVFRDILFVGSANRLLIEAGEASSGSALDFSVGSDITYASSGTITYSDSTKVITVPGGNLTSVLNLSGGGLANVAAGEVYVEIAGTGDGTAGLWKVDPAVAVTDTTLTLTGTGPGDDFTAVTTLILLQEPAGGATDTDGTTAAQTAVEIRPTTSVDFLTDITGTDTNYAVVITGGTSGQAIASVDSARQITLAGALADSSNIDFEVVEHTQAVVLALDTDNDEVTVTLARNASGVSTNTYAELVTAITSSGDPSYDADVAAAIVASATGSGTVTVADVGTVSFDGGVDDQQLLLDEDLLGSTTPTAQVYVSYKALRMDVTAEVDDPSLLSYDSTTEADAAIGPINTTENPLGLGFYFALTNSPSNSVKGIGVGAPDASDADWSTAWSAALTFLLGQEVYALAPLTQDPTIHQLVDSHVTSASQAENKAERIAFINRALPTHSTAAVIASGTRGNTGVVLTIEEFSTSFDFSLLTTPVAEDDILVVAAKSSSTEAPSAVDGTVGPVYGVKVDGVKSGDDFVLELDSTDVAAITGGQWDNFVDVNWTLYRPGSPITAASDQATAVADVGESFANKRMFNVWPDTVTAALGGSEQNIPGFYLAAAWAGKVGEAAPQAPFTNRTVAGFTALKHSNGYFSESQLDEIAGGGTFICIQESAGASLLCRHQLATDVSTLENRELSITKAVDFAAKFLRDTLSPQIGQFNITDQFLTALSVTVQSLLRWFVETGLVRSASLITLEPDADTPDTVNITVLLEVLYPANYIAITLEV